MRYKTLCVYCGSSRGSPPDVLAAARRFGRELAESGVELVYGGGGIGVMGALAGAALEAGGRVIGVIPEFLQSLEVAMPGLSETIVTDSMHERKWVMFEKSDAFIALPGGIGTLEELVEVLSWATLRTHRHPLIIVNMDDYWSPLFSLIDHMVARGFMSTEIYNLYYTVAGVEDVLPLLDSLDSLDSLLDSGAGAPSRSSL